MTYRPTPTGANIVITHCPHGLDMRLNARCYLCQPAAPAVPSLTVERLTEARALLNSLGIVGPNIRHEEQGMYPDGKHSEDNTWDGPGWCVCRRTWPCEAKRLGEVVAALATPEGTEPTPTGAPHE